MKKLISTVLSPEDLKKLSSKQLNILAKEIRSFLIETLSQTGGHLASNLGVVELTIALHYCFDSPTDRMIWDVGHQSYVHKILTGRKSDFHSLRQMDGMSGFPKPTESEHDIFGTGHSSTSISAALGIATARDLAKENYSVISIIGDGSMTGGMAFEALNHAGRGNTNLIVILNDNEMSISENVGGLSKYLNKIRTDKTYLNAKKDIEQILQKVPLVGDGMVELIRRTKESIRTFFVPGVLFEELGFTYIGPVDGHNMQELLQVLSKAKKMNGPILIHVKTIKGKGYPFAENEPEKYHGVSPFVPKTGESIKDKAPITYSDAFGQTMIQLAKKDKRVVAITAAMPEGTGLKNYAKVFPKRFFDVGIAEQHSVTFAAGLAIEGYKPVVAIYSTFMQRAYDQILHDVCIQSLPVIFAIDRGGIVGEDGSTHQGVFDIAYLSHIPNMTIMAPKNYAELKYMIEFAISYQGPIAIRYPRGSEGKNVAQMNTIPIEYGRSEILQEGETVAIIAIGKMVETAIEVAYFLKAKGVIPYVINARFAKPIDEDTLELISPNIQHIVTLEDHMISGGFGENLLSVLKRNDQWKHIHLHNIGFPDEFIEHGSCNSIYSKYGLDQESIANKIYSYINR